MFDLTDIKPSMVVGLVLAGIKYKHSASSTPAQALMHDVKDISRFTILDEVFASPETYIEKGNTLDLVNIAGLLYNAVKKKHVKDQDIPGTVNDWLSNKNKDELIELILQIDLNDKELGGKTAGTELLDSLPPLFRGAISLAKSGIERYGQKDDHNMSLAADAITQETRSLNNLGTK